MLYFTVLICVVLFLDPSALLGCPGNLNTGDIYTHTYHGYENSIIDNSSREILSDVIDARSRGVLFDVGHGAGSFSWVVAEIAAKLNFFPDLLGNTIISRFTSY